MVLVEEAVDEGIRVICINDFVDTEEHDWRERLHDAARHHARSNKFISYRIKRSHDALWELGAAIGKLRPGYSRRASYPSTDRDPERGPFFDSLNTTEAATIKSAYEMVAAGDNIALVAAWLTKQGLRKCAGSKFVKYSVKDVCALIRRSIHRGHDVYRKRVTVKKLRTGKPRQRHDPAQMLTRDMPHLRIVSDALWYAANRKIDERQRNKRVPSGDNHPLANVTRETRFPLTNLFVCGICGNKMWGDGRNEGGYRCGGVRDGSCWNKATTLRDFAHQQISKAIVHELLSLGSTLHVIVDHISELLRLETSSETQRSKLSEKVQRLTERCVRLAEAIANGSSNGNSTTILNLLQSEEQLLEEAKSQLKELDEQTITRLEVSPEIIRRQIRQTASDLLDLDRTAGLLLARLIDGKIQAFPHQQFGSNKIVLRAEFDFRPVGILPDQLRAALAGRKIELTPEAIPSKKIVLDLFELSHAPRFAMRAVKIKEASPTTTLEELGKELGISKRSAHLALEMGKEMGAIGITDPFVRLREKPDRASRWRSHKTCAF